MNIAILGSGPITNKLAQELIKDNSVKFFTGRKAVFEDIPVFGYRHFLSQPLNFDIVIVAWRGMPKLNTTKYLVLKHLAAHLSVNALIINLSSVAIYGQNLGINSEIDTPNPINKYGASKYGLECFLDCFALSKVCHLRISNVFGDDEFNDIVNIALNSIFSGKKLELVSSHTITRDFISINTLLRVIRKIVASSSILKNREIYNVASGISITLYDLISYIETLTGKKIILVNRPISDEIIENSFISNEKMKKLLNLKIDSQLLELNKYIFDRLKVCQ